MPTLIIDNVPESLYDRIQHLAKIRQGTPADTVLDVLERAFRTTTATLVEAPLPQQPLLSEEICAPCIPRPKGTPVRAVHVPPPVPTAHDLPDQE